MNIGQRIKLRREELGIGQRELAEKLGYKNNSTLSGIESGKVDLTQSRIVAIAKALDVTPGWLMGWEENKAAIPTDMEEMAALWSEANEDKRRQAIQYLRFILSEE